MDKKQSKHSVTIRWGQEDKTSTEDDRPVNTYGFNAEKELDSFLEGVNEAVGWLECEFMEKDKLTWTCHICKSKRPDDKISVFTKPSEANGISFKQNIRYCNDNPACIEGAKTFSFFKEKENQS